MASFEAHAISVVSDYLANGTLELTESTSKIYSIRLQNPTDNEVGIKIDYDATFIKVIDYKDVYVLPPRTTGYRINFNVTAPKKTGEYTVGYTVSEVEPSAGGGLPIRLKINRNFKLRVTEGHVNQIEEINKLPVYDDKSYPSAVNSPYMVILSIVILFLFGIFIKKKHAKKNRKVNK